MSPYKRKRTTFFLREIGEQPWRELRRQIIAEPDFASLPYWQMKAPEIGMWLGIDRSETLIV